MTDQRPAEGTVFFSPGSIEVLVLSPTAFEIVLVVRVTSIE